jgi:hypothetical protein
MRSADRQFRISPGNKGDAVSRTKRIGSHPDRARSVDGLLNNVSTELHVLGWSPHRNGKAI